MPSFPAPFHGAAALYPVTRAERYPVRAIRFSDYSEQRWKRCGTTARFLLQLGGITESERQDIFDFFDDVKGDFDATWDISLGGTTYQYLAFADPELTSVEGPDGLIAMVVNIVQVRI